MNKPQFEQWIEKRMVKWAAIFLSRSCPSIRFRIIIALLSVLGGLSSFVPPKAASATDQLQSTRYNWRFVARGVEYVEVPFVIAGRPRANLIVARIAPSAVLFRIYYQIGQRKTIHDWGVEKPSAVVLVNANYFTTAGRPIGLVRIGSNIMNPATNRPDSGQFLVQDEVPEIIPLTTNTQKQKPATKNSISYSESFEGFPFLITQGKLSSFAAADPEVRARRTVIAKDTAGRVVIVVTSPLELSLQEIANWLQDSGLEIYTALNLDGGSSSQIQIAGTDFLQIATPVGRVPVVLAVFAR